VNVNIEKYIGTLIGGITGEVLGTQSSTSKRICLLRQNTINTLLLFKKNSDVGTWLQPGKSSHNGSIMRICPIGLMNWDSERVMKEVKKAIYYTHGASEDSCYSAFLHCRLINALVNNRFKYKYEYFNYILGHAKKYRPLWVKMNLVRYCVSASPPVNITAELMGDENAFQIEAIDAIDAICCAIYIFFRFYERPKEALIYAANLGGDTDTIGKLVGDLCGALHGIKWIPNAWRYCEGEEEEFTTLATMLY
jgi:ADP-ribosylglycohydrolase